MTTEQEFEESNDQARQMIMSGFCPACARELDERETEICEDLYEVTKYCWHCGWEGGSSYE